jgi:hypothetical protein
MWTQATWLGLTSFDISLQAACRLQRSTRDLHAILSPQVPIQARLGKSETPKCVSFSLGRFWNKLGQRVVDKK